MKINTKKPNKQRKMLFQARKHERYGIMSAHLSSALREKHGTRSFPVRKGDTVRVMRGDYKGFEGKILRVDRKAFRVFIDGINREKADGTSILIPIHPSKAGVIRLNLEDKRRANVAERRKLSKEGLTSRLGESDTLAKTKVTKDQQSERTKTKGEN